MKTGLAISTRDRRSTFNECMTAYRQHTPESFPIVAVDDGSTIPLPSQPGVTVIRNRTPHGIAATKNRCIAALMDLGCDRLLLSDDDCWPTAPDYWQPFTETDQHHTLFQPTHTLHCHYCGDDVRHIYNTIAGRFCCPNCHPEVKPIHHDRDLFAVQWGSGVFYSLTRKAVETVGGMRPQFGIWSAETFEYSYRIHNAGLTRYPFQSPHTAPLYALDAYSRGRRSSVPEHVRRDHRQRNWDLFQHFKDSADYVPYTPTTVDATVCIPWRPQPDRIRAHDRVVKFWAEHGYPVVEADSDPNKPFLCNQARNNAARQAQTDTIILCDADTIPADINQIQQAIQQISVGTDVVWPFTTYRHIAPDTDSDPATVEVRQEYRHGSPGGIIVADRRKYWSIGGFDERFTPGAWAWDDTAFMYAAQTLLHTQRLPGVVYSYDHAVDNAGTPGRDLNASPNRSRYFLYEFANGTPELMRELVK